jgi:hypothetical protein
MPAGKSISHYAYARPTAVVLSPIKITGKKPINLILTFFHYYGCLMFNLKILTWILYGRAFYLKANLRVLEI